MRFCSPPHVRCIVKIHPHIVPQSPLRLALAAQGLRGRPRQYRDLVLDSGMNHKCTPETLNSKAGHLCGRARQHRALVLAAGVSPELCTLN